jgi:hypothetical protein
VGINNRRYRVVVGRVAVAPVSGAVLRLHVDSLWTGAGRQRERNALAGRKLFPDDPVIAESQLRNARVVWRIIEVVDDRPDLRCYGFGL